MVLYINNTVYYQQDKSKVLSPEKIANAAKCMNIEPKVVFKNIFAQVAYNQRHQLAIAMQVADFITIRNQDIRLLVINNQVLQGIKVRELCRQYFEGSNRNTFQGLCSK